MSLEIPKDKIGHPAVSRTRESLPHHSFIFTPDKTRLFVETVDAARNSELVSARRVLFNYTRRIASNPEAACQDIESVEKMREYLTDPDYAYFVFKAVDKEGNIRGTAPGELASLEDIADLSADNGVILTDSSKIIKEKGIGFIYQVGVDSLASAGFSNLSVVTQMYNVLPDALKHMSSFSGVRRKNNWLGVVTESRAEGPELEAMLKADFKILVPNEFYRPPATQEVENPENEFTTDLVLLGKRVPRHLREIASRAYVIYSYSEGQNIVGTLSLMEIHFAGNAGSGN